MTYAARTATVILAGFLAIASTCGRAAGQGGGHGGSGGGHGFGGHAGHSGGGLLQRIPQVIRLDTRSDTLSLIFLDITAKEPVP